MAGMESTDHFDNDEEYSNFGSSSVRPRFKNGLDMQKLLSQGTSFEIDTEDGIGFLQDAEDIDDPSFTELYKEQVLDKKNKHLETLFNTLALEDFSGNYDDLAAKMLNITEDGGVKKLKVNEGVGDVVSDLSKIFVHYIGVCEGSDEPFDSTIVRGKPQPFTLGDPNVLPGLYLAFKTMRISEVSKFLLSPQYAFGNCGAPPRVPPNCRILFTVELLDSFPEDQYESILRKSADERALMEFSVICREAEKLRDEGNTTYSESKFSLAIRRYRSGIRILEEYPVVNDSNENNRNQILFTLYINLAQAYLKMEKAPQACVASRMALRFKEASQGKLYKAYFRFAQAKFQLKGYEEARELCEKALKLEPSSTCIARLNKEILQKLREDESNLKYVYQRMFQGSDNGNKTSNDVTDTDTPTSTDSAISSNGSASLDGASI